MIVVILKKYELLEDDKIVVSGHTLSRLRALRDFGKVKKGDLGGYIEKESNLSHDRDCWVYDDAKVFGDARVFGNAQVQGNAQVRGKSVVCNDVFVYGNAQVSGDAQVHGDAVVSGSPTVRGDADIATISDIFWLANVGSENGILTVYKGKDGNLKVAIGYFSGTGDELLEQSARVDSEKTHREFQLFLELAKLKITLT